MDTVGLHDIKPCDVFLYRGRGIVPGLIRLFDGGNYSHSALYDGEQVVEAIAEGVRRRSLQESIGDAEYVDVFRFGKGGHHLGDAGWPAAPVCRHGERLRAGRRSLCV